jgi:hypothetical protein
LHLNLTGGAQVVNLGLAGTRDGVTVVIGPSNAVEKTYTVTVN